MSVGGSQGADRVRVLGIGNVLMGDDAFGPWVVHLLEHTYDMPPGVAVVDVGTPGLDLTPFLQEVEAVVFVDAVSATGAPGELRSYRKAEILAHDPGPRLSPHDPSLREALLVLDFAGRGPREALLVGAIPASTEKGTGLSPAMRAALGPAVAGVVAELTRLGFPPVRRERHEAREVPLPWWERAAAEADRG